VQYVEASEVAGEKQIAAAERLTGAMQKAAALAAAQ
jgi:hypothetical protein